MIVDLFAGGGGASVGIEAATGRTVDLAINHSPIALAVHKANHPKTKHLNADIWAVDPKEAVGRRKVDLLWASPDCTHFSVAKGGKPRETGTRSLAWVVVDWARAVRPTVICLENVREFLGWGPLDNAGQPIKAKTGETFAQWRGALEILGYKVDHRILDASLYGAPTKRRRLFLVARCDGLPIVWPETTHGPGKLPLHTAAECIDWSLPCPSIFERKRPLAEKTLWRIAQGIRRFVLENPDPFIVKVNHGDDARTGSRVHSINEPLTTVTASRRGHALVTPTMITIDNNSSPSGFTPAAAPLPTTTTENRHALVAPTLVQTGYGERPAIGTAPAQRPRYLDIHAPMGTLMAEGVKQGLVSAFLAKHYGGHTTPGSSMAAPMDTITTQDHNAAVEAKLAAVCLAKVRGTDQKSDQSVSGAADEPMPTISGGGRHIAEVRAFLTAYYGDDHAQGMGQDPRQPMRTLTTKARLGLVTVSGIDYQIVDIGMRMLEADPELLRAQFGPFAEGYDLSAAVTKAAKTRMIGNTVCPQMAEAIVAVNLPKALRRAA